MKGMPVLLGVAMLAPVLASAQCDIGSPDYHNCFMRQQQLNRIEQNTRQAAMATAPAAAPSAQSGAEAAGYALGRALAERRQAKRQERELREMWTSVDGELASNPNVVQDSAVAWQACVFGAVPLFESPTTAAMEVAQRAHDHCSDEAVSYCIALVSSTASKEEIDVPARSASFGLCMVQSFPLESTARSILALRERSAGQQD